MPVSELKVRPLPRIARHTVSLLSMVRITYQPEEGKNIHILQKTARATGRGR